MASDTRTETMLSTSRFLTATGVIAIAIVIGLGLGWLASRPRASVPWSAKPTAPTALASAKRSSPVTATAPVPTAQPDADEEMSAEPAPPDTSLITDWVDRIDAILSDASEVDEKARQLLALFPRMPEEGQVETAQHISNLIADEDYPKFGCYLTNSTVGADVLDVLMTDLLNRPNSTKLPMLLAVARDPNNPKSADAKDTLELYLGEGYGTNWDAWDEKINEWLKENPD